MNYLLKCIYRELDNQDQNDKDIHLAVDNVSDDTGESESDLLEIYDRGLLNDYFVV